MKKIKIEGLDFESLELLQQMLHDYYHHLINSSLKNSFLDTLVSLDISLQIYYFLRKKIENNKKKYNLNISVSNAAIILKCAIFYTSKNEYQQHLITKLKSQIDPQLKSVLVGIG